MGNQGSALLLTLLVGAAALAAGDTPCRDMFGNPAPCMPGAEDAQQAFPSMAYAPAGSLGAPPFPGTPGPPAGFGAAAAAAGPGPIFPAAPGMSAFLAGPCGGKCQQGEFCDASAACRPDTCQDQHTYGCPDDREPLQAVACPPGFAECYSTSAFECFKGPGASRVSCRGRGGASSASSSSSGGGGGGGATDASASASAGGGGAAPAAPGGAADGPNAVQTSVGSTTRADTKSLGSASSQPVTTPALAALVGGANASAVVDSASQAQAPLPANLPAQRTTSAAGARGAPLFGLLGRSAWARPAWAAALMALPSFGSALGARASAGFGGFDGAAFFDEFEAMWDKWEDAMDQSMASPHPGADAFTRQPFGSGGFGGASGATASGGRAPRGGASASSYSSSGRGAGDVDDCAELQRSQCAGDGGRLKTVACPAGGSFTTCYESEGGGFKCYLGGGSKSVGCAVSGNGGGRGRAHARASSAAGGERQTVSASRRRA
ncbi:hypothetical protein MNEG_10105 [Monoraphidium neglectum]|uniref:Uncharacterized protein n=1 Tax=Monoraphidium neglectum TaxID=145388 RepID=A0A0D2KQF7_9CHLO|nr:hypothetical protein MNEG_10105 [Monoraphidium neglectum]KIY97858.1 hypothetical protein MNEG_10105 [Monoraphidium neglectum]|eukprot:XP_013896878.1 hypothetical protein MNEG_10105 [Monoraphidium neglectum]